MQSLLIQSGALDAGLPLRLQLLHPHLRLTLRRLPRRSHARSPPAPPRMSPRRPMAHTLQWLRHRLLTAAQSTLPQLLRLVPCPVPVQRRLAARVQ